MKTIIQNWIDTRGLSKEHTEILKNTNVKNLLMRPTQQGVAWRFDLEFKGKRIALIENHGFGGCTLFYAITATPTGWASNSHFAFLKKALRLCIPNDYQAFSTDPLDCFMEMITAYFEEGDSVIEGLAKALSAEYFVP